MAFLQSERENLAAEVNDICAGAVFGQPRLLRGRNRYRLWGRIRVCPCSLNGFIEALNGLVQSAKRRAHGYRRFETTRAVFFLIAGKLDLSKISPHAA